MPWRNIRGDRHGPITDCPLAATEEFVQEYISLPEGSAERVLIERRYGKANVLRLVAKFQEELANRQWLERSTTSCPNCRVPVEKSLGCNHVRHCYFAFFPSTKHPLICVASRTDDMRQVRAAFLLSLRGQAERKQPVRTLLDPGCCVFFEAV